jgi:glycosyltransferase involved in cell wall biosynthesis
MGAQFASIPLDRTGLNPLRDIKCLFAIFGHLRRIKPTRVLSYTIKPVVYGGIAARMAQVPLISAMVTGLGFSFIPSGRGVGSSFARWISRSMYRLGLRWAQVVFVQNPDDALVLVESGMVEPSRLVRINGSGIDLQHFSVAPLPTTVTFLMIARLLADKGVREYAEACRVVRQARPGLRCVLVGPVDTNPTAIQLVEVESWVNAGFLEYGGEARDVRPYISSASVYVLPSYREGTPRTVLEAMAMGRAIITTDVPGCRETVVHGENGLLVPHKDAASLSAAMLRLAEDSLLVSGMGRKSRKLAEDRFDVRNVTATILAAMCLPTSPLST